MLLKHRTYMPVGCLVTTDFKLLKRDLHALSRNLLLQIGE